mmetsp:Transcript_16174/g.48008  ORF Transcript_16174/g.48008 Transcript_16174/m.48008 type:complete len:541 (+) Transcript_16174:239-1861(+)
MVHGVMMIVLILLLILLLLLGHLRLLTLDSLQVPHRFCKLAVKLIFSLSAVCRLAAIGRRHQLLGLIRGLFDVRIDPQLKRLVMRFGLLRRRLGSVALHPAPAFEEQGARLRRGCLRQALRRPLGVRVGGQDLLELPLGGLGRAEGLVGAEVVDPTGELLSWVVDPLGGPLRHRVGLRLGRGEADGAGGALLGPPAPFAQLPSVRLGVVQREEVLALQDAHALARQLANGHPGGDVASLAHLCGGRLNTVWPLIVGGRQVLPELPGLARQDQIAAGEKAPVIVEMDRVGRAHLGHRARGAGRDLHGALGAALLTRRAAMQTAPLARRAAAVLLRQLVKEVDERSHAVAFPDHGLHPRRALLHERRRPALIALLATDLLLRPVEVHAAADQRTVLAMDAGLALAAEGVHADEALPALLAVPGAAPRLGRRLLPGHQQGRPPADVRHQVVGAARAMDHQVALELHAAELAQRTGWELALLAIPPGIVFGRLLDELVRYVIARPASEGATEQSAKGPVDGVSGAFSDVLNEVPSAQTGGAEKG